MICCLLITNGGAKRMISPCVGFASKPFSANCKHTSQAVLPAWDAIENKTGINLLKILEKIAEILGYNVKTLSEHTRKLAQAGFCTL